MTTRLELCALTAGYERASILHAVNLHVEAGEIVGVLGANGAGKTTLLRTIMGATRVHSGDVMLYGQKITRRPSWWRARKGIAHVPEARRLFPGLTVEENLNVGGLHSQDASAARQEVFDLFPRLFERRKAKAATLSGGEQQMLAVGRALMSEPKFLLIDEMSAGLAPVIAEDLMDRLAHLARTRNAGFLVVEQAPHVLEGLTDRVYLLDNGHLEFGGTLADLGGADGVVARYLLG